jgi:hypothetical protein
MHLRLETREWVTNHEPWFVLAFVEIRRVFWRQIMKRKWLHNQAEELNNQMNQYPPKNLIVILEQWGGAVSEYDDEDIIWRHRSCSLAYRSNFALTLTKCFHCICDQVLKHRMNNSTTLSSCPRSPDRVPFALFLCIRALRVSPP